MVIGRIVWDPEEIRDTRTADRYLAKITDYEQKTGKGGGVLMIQRNHSDGLYLIVSVEEAEKELKTPVSRDRPEFGIKFYAREYFEALRKRLDGDLEVDLPEPVKRSDFIFKEKD